MPRRLGQHFLFDPAILGRIAAACGDAPAQVIEIGPGPGGLTRALLARARHVAAIELDPALAARLRTAFPAETRLEVVEADVLKVDLAQWGAAVVAGNLPYYITSPIIARTLALGPLLERAVFLIQREVAERLAAAPGGREYGYLSVATQLRCRVELLFDVKPGAFRPPPKVTSCVVRLTPHTGPLCPDLDRFLRFASACFRQKRKTLGNNLASLYPRNLLEAQAESGLRAEQLSVRELLELHARLG